MDCHAGFVQDFGLNLFLRGCRIRSVVPLMSFWLLFLKENENFAAIIQTDCTMEGKYQFLAHRLFSKQQKEHPLK